LFSANNPFQEGFPFMYDTAFQKNFAKKQQKCFHRRGIMSQILIDDYHSSDDDDEIDQGGN
jgi:hypothetical protein